MNNKKPFFIAVNTKSDNDAPHLIKTEYNYEVGSDMYDTYNKRGFPVIYDFLGAYLSNINLNDNIPITISSDRTISSTTINAVNEKYMIQQGETFSSQLKILFITDCPSLETNSELQVEQENYSGLEDFVVSSLTGLTDIPIVSNKLLVRPEQLMYVGLNKDEYKDDVQYDNLDNLEITYFDLERIEKIGIKKVVKSIRRFINNSPVHVVFNISAISPQYAMSTFRKESDIKNGMLPQEVSRIIDTLKLNNVVSIDIVGLNARVDSVNKKASRISAEVARVFIVQLLDLKEKKINIYNEFSRFLICRPIDQGDFNDDHGWHILRGIPTELREELINNITIGSIITIPVDGDDYLVTTTTIIEQEQLNYELTKSIYDLCLFPEEKKNMMFELVNTTL
jgi:arginase family enzyme